MTLSGKRTHSGRASGETVLNDGTEGAKEFYSLNSQVKEQRIMHIKLWILYFFFYIKEILRGCLDFI